MQVQVFVWVRGKEVRAQDVKDAATRSGLLKMGQTVGTQLATVTCPEHGRGPRDVRIVFDAKGNGDLKYDACCAKLSAEVAKATG